MKFTRVLAATACAASMIASAAHSGIYDLSFKSTSGPAFTFSATLVTLTGGHIGYAGSTTDQTWGGGNSTSFGGWIDFSPGGETLGLEGASAGKNTYYDFTSSTPFYSLTETSPGHFDLTLDQGEFTLTNVAINNGVSNPSYGDTGTLTITDPPGLPEPTSWALIMTGVAGFGAALRGRRGAPSTAA